MEYHVILIENGKPTHRWCYDDPAAALCQLERLLFAYVDVDAVSATLVKTDILNHGRTCSELILNQIVPPISKFAHLLHD